MPVLMDLGASGVLTALFGFRDRGQAKSLPIKEIQDITAQEGVASRSCMTIDFVVYYDYSHNYGHWRHRMRTVSKSMLKSKMLGIFREIEKSGEDMTVTDNGNPVLRIEPLRNRQSVDQVFADVRGAMKFQDDHEDTVSEWGDLTW
jgi:antitoxin (DNA-binding transcriptional repressor) of toxin-antitoxin stability system